MLRGPNPTRKRGIWPLLPNPSLTRRLGTWRSSPQQTRQIRIVIRPHRHLPRPAEIIG
jgi:hypothetical protein